MPESQSVMPLYMTLPTVSNLDPTPPNQLCDRAIRLELYEIHACINTFHPYAFNALLRIKSLVAEMNSRGIFGDEILLKVGDIN